MCAVYAFMRHCDDLSDEPGASRTALEEWRVALSQAFAGAMSPHPILPALKETVARYRIPRSYFYEMIEGVLTDLNPRRFEVFAELYEYCYKVASVVGMTIIHIFGFESPDALKLAEKCGVAFQLTNILRDIREDSDRGRQYLPVEDLVRFGVSEDELKAGLAPRFVELMRFEADRAAAMTTSQLRSSSLYTPAAGPHFGP
jgi:phytoene synthase